MNLKQYDTCKRLEAHADHLSDLMQQQEGSEREATKAALYSALAHLRSMGHTMGGKFDYPGNQTGVIDLRTGETTWYELSA